jgi:hypothetical protein
MDNVVPFLIVCSPFAFVIVVSVLYRRNNERMAEKNLPPDDLRRADDGSGYDNPGQSFGSWPNL